MRRKNKDLSEITRIKLNKIKGKNYDGSDKKLNWQFLTWFVGGIAENSNDQTIRKTGRKLRNGAEDSFSDYVGEKISKTIKNYLNSL